MTTIENYYAGGYTSIGFHSLYTDILRDLKNVYILKGGPGTGKSTLIKKIASTLSMENYDIQLFHHPLQPRAIDGVVIPSLQAAVIDGTPPHAIDPMYPHVTCEIVNLGEFVENKQLQNDQAEIIQITDEYHNQTKKAIDHLAKAHTVHEQIENLYLSAMDFSKADQVTERLQYEIFQTSPKAEENPQVKRYFFGAATPEGVLNFIDDITKFIQYRYIIKGRSGSGKSTMLKKIGQHAENQNLTVHYFPCGFDPRSIDMIIIPSLSVALLDGTSPHIIDPSRDTDQVVDMFELCIDPQIEVDEGDQIEELHQQYKSTVKQGVKHLKEAQHLHDNLKRYYKEAVNFHGVNHTKDQILSLLKATSVSF